MTITHRLEQAPRPQPEATAAEEIPADIKKYLQRAWHSNFLTDIEQAMAKADNMRILFVGERIIDEYKYVTCLGASSKEPNLAVAEIGYESFNGGVSAAQAHGEWLNTKLLTHFAPITKTRFVEKDFNHKLFESYSGLEICMSPEQRSGFLMELERQVAEADVVIVFDFGHGLIDHNCRSVLYKARFLAVNAQTNAGNRGFNLVTKYKKADYICVDVPEAQLALGRRLFGFESVQSLAIHLGAACNVSHVVLTHGKQGCIGTSVVHETFAIPAFASHPVDTIGAGDAFLAVSAPLVAAGCPLEKAAFAGNLAGAIKVGIVGHRENVTRAALNQALHLNLVQRCGLLKHDAISS